MVNILFQRTGGSDDDNEEEDVGGGREIPILMVKLLITQCTYTSEQAFDRLV